MESVETNAHSNSDLFTVLVRQRPEEDANRGRRGSERVACPEIRVAICCDGGLTSPDELEFLPVRCHDISASGIGLLLPAAPDFRHAVVAFGEAPSLTYIDIEVMRSSPHHGPEGGFLVACRFIFRAKDLR